MNIAIFSPNQNPYSETFIQAHKKNLKGKIFYYYGAGNQIKLENDTLKNTLLDRSQFKLFKRLSYFWKVKLLKSLRDNKIDSILIEYGNHAHNLLPLLKKLEIPFVVHFHGYDASVNSVVETCNNYKDVFNLANKVIVVSNVMKQKIENMGCTKNKIVLSTYGPNDLFFNIKPTFSKKQFISIGRFAEKKAPN